MSGPTLVRRESATGPRQEWRSPDAPADVDEAPVVPRSRIVRFEIPEGFMASISLVPYTETAAALADAMPELPPADPALIGQHV